MELKDFVERFANNIFSVYPEWRAYGKSFEYDEYVISVPVPSQKDENNFLCIFVEEKYEVIIRFDMYYKYFITYCYDSEHEWLNDILEYIQGIQDEMLVIATTLHDNHRNREVIEAHNIPNFPYKILDLKSWNGTFDMG